MKYIRLIFLTLCLVAWAGFPALASTSETDIDTARPATIAVLPFVMHTPETHSHIQQGVMTMLNTRLAWPDQVQVIPGREIFNILDELPEEKRNQVVSQVARKPAPAMYWTAASPSWPGPSALMPWYTTCRKTST